MKNQQTPFAQYLADLPEWDKTPRLDTLFTGYLGADNTLFNKKAAEVFGVAVVARAECPGIAWNHMPILVGKQGCGKSLFLKSLFAGGRVVEIYSMAHSDRDLCQIIGGFTCVDLSCLENPMESAKETLRNFISRAEDEYRPIYHEAMVKHPRDCVFVGTTNNNNFLVDPTGNRRYWEINVKISQLDIDALAHERDQIWAEAKHLWELAVVAAGDKCAINLDAMAANLPAPTEE